MLRQMEVFASHRYDPPISALNNSFPSKHVSLRVVVITVCCLFQVRRRNTVGITIILATFPRGIHWVADIVAGAAKSAA
jgi:PAP2 superfamily